MSNASAGVHARNMQAAFADKNAAEFPLKRANDGGFYPMILRSQPVFLSLKSTALRSTKTTESIRILIGKVYLSALLREKKDGGMCPARVTKCVLREQKNTFCCLFF